MADFMRSVKAVLAGYIIGVVGRLLGGLLLKVLGVQAPLAGAVLALLFTAVGGFAAARVTQRLRIVTAAAVGAVQFLWTLYATKLTGVSWLLVLLIAAGAAGGWLAVKSKPVVGDNERI